MLAFTPDPYMTVYNVYLVESLKSKIKYNALKAQSAVSLGSTATEEGWG